MARVAREHFQVGGYGEVSLRQIAQVAGKSQSSIFRYWADKAGLWREVMGCEPPSHSDAAALDALVEVQGQTLTGLNSLLCELRAGLPADELEGQVRALIELQASSLETAMPIGLKAGSDGESCDHSVVRGDEAPAEVRGTRGELGAISPIEARLGGRIRKRRLERGLTLVALAQRMMMSFTHLGRYELGRSRVPATTIPRLAQALGCSASDLLDGLHDDGPRAI